MSGSKQSTSSVHFKNPARIIGIQFGMLSPEEIRKGVVEVVSKDTYVGNKEVPGGLFDPRMGVLGRGSICPTDGLDYIQTPDFRVEQREFILDFLKNCDGNLYATLRDHNTKLKIDTQLKPLDIKCHSCGHEYKQEYALNPSDFFG